MTTFKTLRELVTFRGGGTPSKKIPEYWNGDIPWASVKDFTSTSLRETQDFISKEGLKNSSANLIPKGHVIIPTRMSLGKAAINTVDLAINQDLRALVPKIPLDTEFLLYAILSLKDEIIKKGSGATVKGITQEELYKLEIAFPPLNDQIRIAHLLGKVERLIAQRKQHLQQLDDFLKSMFLEMFGDPVKNEKGWDTGLIIDHCDVKGGKRIPKGEKLVAEDTGYPYIKAGNIKNGIVTTNDMEYVTPEVRKTISRYTVDAGDICITVVGANIGDVGIVPTELHKASLTENANKLLIKNKKTLNNHYLTHYLMSNYVQQQIANSIRAAGVPKLAIFRIEQMLLLLPPIALQVKFENAKKIIESLMLRYKKSLIDLEALYGALSQQAFRGELDLSRVTLPTEHAKQNIEEVNKLKNVAINVPLNDFFRIPHAASNAKVRMPKGRKAFLKVMLSAWLEQYSHKSFSLTDFMEIVQNKLWDLTDGELHLNMGDYDQIKNWLFEALKAKKIQQTYDDDNNRVQLKPRLAKGKQA